LSSAGHPSQRPEYAPAQVRRIVLGLLPAIFIGAVDQTMVSVALYSIGRDLQNVGLMSWVVSAYLVAATVCTPIYGKLSDLYGRRHLLSIALGVCLVASVLCATAQTMPQLIAYRVLQGLGAGSLFALSQAAVADVVSGPQRGRYQGYFSGVFATAAVAGPLLGGFLSHYLSWRAIFWVNLPLAAITLWIVRRVLAPIPVERHAHRIDWLGAALLTGGIGLMLVALTRVGQGAGWTAASTLVLAAGGAAFLATWVLQSMQATEPIVPLSLFRNRIVSASCATVALNFFTLIGVSVMLPLAMQSVGGSAADEAALRMLPLTLGVPLGALVGGRIMLRWPDYRALAIGGCALAAAALGGIALVPFGWRWALAALMLPLGIGLGITLPVVLVASQMAVGPQLIGLVTATTAFFRSLGGAIGIAMLTSLLFVAIGAADAVTDAPGGAAARPALAMLAGSDPHRLDAAFSIAFAAAGLSSLLAAFTAHWLPRRDDAAPPLSTRRR
jgi:EmrB/QacA subfamily drug resistance transporter